MASSKVACFAQNLCNLQTELGKPSNGRDTIPGGHEHSILAKRRVLQLPRAAQGPSLELGSSFFRGSSLHLCSAQNTAFSVSQAVPFQLLKDFHLPALSLLFVEHIAPFIYMPVLRSLVLSVNSILWTQYVVMVQL